MSIAIAIAAASFAWFVAAAVLFFNPVVDGMYKIEEDHPSVRVLPQTPTTIGKILGAVIAQVVLWAGVWLLVVDGLGSSTVERALAFTAVIALVKIVPRDIDRVLLTTYPPRRLAIEFVIGLICAGVVGGCFAWLL